MGNENCLSLRRASIVAREGWIFVFLFGGIAAVFSLFGIWYVAIPVLLLALFTVFFFRNPERVTPEGGGLIISPADGTIVDVADLETNAYTDSPARKIGIFMSIFNVHINRAPMAAKVRDIRYHAGKFFVASTDKASDANERNAILLDAEGGALIAVVQIAGIVARRIVCYLSKGDGVMRGERLGLIRFGSRVDLYLPAGTDIDVSKGDKVKAGVTVIGRLR